MWRFLLLILFLYPSCLKNWFWAASALSHLFRPHSCRVLVHCHSLRFEKSGEPSCPIPNFSVSLGISLCAVEKKDSIPVGSVLAPPSAPTIVIDPGHGGTDRGARSKQPF